jgi:hypothetical protein
MPADVLHIGVLELWNALLSGHQIVYYNTRVEVPITPEL